MRLFGKVIETKYGEPEVGYGKPAISAKISTEISSLSFGIGMQIMLREF